MGSMLRVGVLAAIVMTTSTGAWADDTEGEALSPAMQQRARDRQACTEELKPLERAVESDGKYAEGYRDAWLLTGVAAMALSLTAAFQNYGYRRTEGIVGAIQSSLLLIQKPDAVQAPRALRGIRTAEAEDPCLALANVKQIIRANWDDYWQHNHWWQHLIAMGVPILVGAIMGVATNHFDYATNGNEGANMTVGVVLGELQVLTFPRPSMHVPGEYTHDGPPPQQVPQLQLGATGLTVKF
jgi:hypothetical protein